MIYGRSPTFEPTQCTRLLNLSLYQPKKSVGEQEQWLTEAGHLLFQASLQGLQQALNAIDDEWSRFVFVHRRYDRLLPGCVNGPLDQLVERTCREWSLQTAQFIGEACMDNMGAALKGLTLSIVDVFQSAGRRDTEKEQMVFGTQFSAVEVPDDGKRLNIAGTLQMLAECRIKIVESLCWISDIFLMARDNLVPTPYHNSHFVPFCPLASNVKTVSPPLTTSAADLSRAAFRFRNAGYKTTTHSEVKINLPFIFISDPTPQTESLDEEPKTRQEFLQLRANMNEPPRAAEVLLSTVALHLSYMISRATTVRNL